MKVLSLFSGIGAFEKALKNLQVPVELVGFSEIDKYAVKSYCAIHNVSESLNLGDITKIDAESLPNDIDLITYGFPCQDISLAGAQKGLFNADGTKTRSGLFFDALRIIETAKPKIAIAENVKNLTGKKFKEQFAIVLSSLESAGYNNYWKVLNAKDYGIPQNRERVFVISIRKDIDNGAFKFPEGFPLEYKLKNFIEDDVDEKYFLPFERVANLIEHKRRNAEKGNGYGAKFVTENDISPSLVTSLDKSTCAYLLIVDDTQGFDGIRFYNNYFPALRASRHGLKIIIDDKEKAARLRKLTPKEYFRLMGFDDVDFEKAEAVNSNTQLYKQAGNSIVVDVLYYIFVALKTAAIPGVM